MEQIRTGEKTRKSAVGELMELKAVHNKLQSLFSTVSEQVASLTSRVKTLESASVKGSSTINEGVITCSPLTSIKLLVSKLFPSVPP
jgi:hypothetical protein